MFITITNGNKNLVCTQRIYDEIKRINEYVKEESGEDSFSDILLDIVEQEQSKFSPESGLTEEELNDEFGYFFWKQANDYLDYLNEEEAK